jgi:hypothetical protein
MVLSKDEVCPSVVGISPEEEAYFMLDFPNNFGEEGAKPLKRLD